MVWEVETECDPREGAHCWGKDDLVGDVTCLATHRLIGHPHSLHSLHITKTFSTVAEFSLGRIQRRLVWRFLPDLTTDTSRLMTDITSHMRRAGRRTRSPLKTGRITVKVKDFGVNAIAAGQVDETIYLYSGSLFGELVVRAILKSKSGDIITIRSAGLLQHLKMP